MVGLRLPENRAVSELTSVAAIVILGLVLVAVVGVNVLYVESTDTGPSATFSYQYFEPQSMLLVTFDSGDSIPAGQLQIEGKSSEATWDALNDQMNASTPVSPGSVVRIGPQGAYNAPVASDETVTVRYLNGSGSATTLSTWNGTS
ncbi:MAG: type IV pilin [Halococcoides sp.]